MLVLILFTINIALYNMIQYDTFENCNWVATQWQ